MKADYAKRKLTSLLADDLSCYTDGEFARQMMRIIDGATGYKVELMMEQNTLLAQRVHELKQRSSELQAQADLSTSLLNLLADIREACGDNGKRMQDELVQYIADLCAKAGE